MEYAYLENAFINALSTLFEFIFSEVFAPILSDILEIFVNYATNIIWNLLADVVLKLFIAICSLVDFIESIFNVFAGVAPVLYKKPGAAQAQTLSLTDVLFDMEAVTTAFWVITLFSLGLCIIFTIFKTAKSISDMTLEDKNPISKVLTDAMKAGFTFFLIPFLCVMMLQLSTVITKQADAAFDATTEGSASIGTILFLSASMDADIARTEQKDLISGEIVYKNNNTPSFDDAVRGPYMKNAKYKQQKDYKDFDQVSQDFHAENFNYIVGFVSAVLILLILCLSSLTFVRRIFELLLLYIVSPLFASTIPLDDGATFAKWREMFIAKFFSGFGTVFAMKYYLMVVPFIANSRLVLYNRSLPNGNMINTILQLFLIIGGAWAVFKAQSLLMELLNPEAAQAEKESTQVFVGAAMTAASIATGGVGAVARGAMGAVGGALASGSQQDSGPKSPQQDRNTDENQAYRG